MTKNKCADTWSCNAGQPGVNWVRAFRDMSTRGKFALEWMEDVPALDAETGVERLVRKRKQLTLPAGTTKREAKAKAERLAAEFLTFDGPDTAPTTIVTLIDNYVRLRTPSKGESKQGHDRRAARIWKAFFGAHSEPKRRGGRSPESLDRVDWDEFIRMRRGGLIPGWTDTTKARQVEYDLKFLIAVLNWACSAGEDGKPYLLRSPWDASVRRAQGWVMPKEPTPHRPSMSEVVEERLIAHSPSWKLSAALRLQRETRRRNAAIRRLLWSDVDLAQGRIRWRGEVDKANRANTTPLSPKAIEILRGLPSRGVGDIPVFAAPKDVARCCSRNVMQGWLQKAKKRLLASIEDTEAQELMRRDLQGVGFHAEKRAGVRDPWFRNLSPKVQEEISGTSYETLRKVYDEVSPEDVEDETGWGATGAESTRVACRLPAPDESTG